MGIAVELGINMAEVNYKTHSEIDHDMADLVVMATGKKLEDIPLDDINSFVTGLYEYYDYHEETETA